MTATSLPQLSGTLSQIEWANRIRLLVDAEFDRVAAALTVASEKQSAVNAAATKTFVGILEEKRHEVLRNESAGYFIRDWQELSDQVRQLLHKDVRYQAIRAAKTQRIATGEF